MVLDEVAPSEIRRNQPVKARMKLGYGGAGVYNRISGASEPGGRFASKAMRAACKPQTRGCRIGNCESVGQTGIISQGALNTPRVVSPSE